MTDRFKRILVLAWLLAIGGGFLLAYEVRDLDFHEKINSSFFVRNLTWQTDFLDRVPYKKWDMLEFSAIFSTEWSQSLQISIDEIRTFLDIEAVEYNDQKIPLTSLNRLNLRESGILKVRWRTKNGSSEENKDASTYFRVEEIGERGIIDQTLAEDIIQTGSTMQTPSDISFSWLRFNTNIPNLLEIRGKNLTSIESINIGWSGIRPTFSSGTLYVEIARDAFSSGEYFIFFTLKNGKVLTVNEKLIFDHSEAKINAAKISPDTVKNDTDRYVVLQGNGFDKIVSIQLSNNIVLKSAEFKVINEHVVGVKIPQWLTPGKYFFNIMDTSSIYELSNTPFTVY